MSALKNYLTVHQGGQDELVLGHQDLVRQVAHHLHARLPASVQLDDLVQSGMEALLTCAHSYDPATGVPFAAYARPRVRGAMIDELRRGNWTPRSIHAKARAISDAVAEIEMEGGDSNDDRQVALKAGLGLDEYHRTLNDASRSQVLSLDEMPYEHREALEDENMDDPSAHTQREQMVKAISDAIPRLPERQKLVLTLYYHEELNQKEIALVLGVTESRVSQIHGQALLKVRGLVQSGAPAGRRARA
ncbi:MAG: RNA polymerase sigma factor FliA [Gammaproteobacteria bacterium]